MHSMYGTSERMGPLSWAEVEVLWQDTHQEAASLAEFSLRNGRENGGEEHARTTSHRGPTVPESFLFG